MITFLLFPSLFMPYGPYSRTKLFSYWYPPYSNWLLKIQGGISLCMYETIVSSFVCTPIYLCSTLIYFNSFLMFIRFCILLGSRRTPVKYCVIDSYHENHENGFGKARKLIWKANLPVPSKIFPNERHNVLHCVVRSPQLLQGAFLVVDPV